MSTRRVTRYVRVLLLLALLLLPVAQVGAQTEPSESGYRLAWWTVDGGGSGGAPAGTGYRLAGTIGQPDAAVLLGGDYTLQGGFWGGTVSVVQMYLPLVVKE